MQVRLQAPTIFEVYVREGLARVGYAMSSPESRVYGLRNIVYFPCAD